jgi:hypothetical protein
MRSQSRILSTTLLISVNASLFFAGASVCRGEGAFPTPPPARAEGVFPTPPPARAEGAFPTPPPAQRGEGAFPTPPPLHAIAIAG